MTLTPEDIKTMESIGKSPSGEILHVATHGGLNLIIQKTRGGELQILSHAPHRGIALHQAQKMHKNIQWNEGLMKSEKVLTHEAAAIQQKKENRDAMGNPIYESTPQNHFDLASHHSKMAGKARESVKDIRSQPIDHPIHQAEGTRERLHNAMMNELMHSDIALKHYQMSGMNEKGAKDEHQKHMALHHEAGEAPFQDYALELAYGRANPGKRRPKGLGNWSK